MVDGRWSMVVCALFLLLPAPVRADKNNFELDARLYTKWLYRNDDSQGVLWLGNPFWPDDIAGNNGVATEFELGIRGNVSKYVLAGARLQSRFGGTWHDWWESGERKYGDEHNTSGDSLGMNRAMYVKFRGFFVHINPDIPVIDWLQFGTSDLAQYNEWTIGKVRYIDRYNPMGAFLLGSLPFAEMRLNAGVIALPKLWVGPGWSTGIGDDKLDYPFFTQDWAYALRLDVQPTDWMQVAWVGSYTRDVEFDRWDPDATGSPNAGCLDVMGQHIPGCTVDHAVGTYPRFRNAVTTLEVTLEPNDTLYIHLLGAFSDARLGKDFVNNGVEENGGMFPVVYDDTRDIAARARVFLADPFDIGLSFKFEGFYIGEHWNSIFGARREADVLLTDGFLSGGQLPTLNLANEFIDFDESWFESCIGWMGGTALVEFQTGGWDIGLEGTYLTYDTNRQGRDVDAQGNPLYRYPTFLYTDGFTDTDLYDYANVGDRGRDPRSVYKRDQDRQTFITMLKAGYTFPFHLTLEGRVKYIRDDDWRRLKDDDGRNYTDDDYLGNLFTGRIEASYPLWQRLTVRAGGQFDFWDETNRSGDPTVGYGDYITNKQKGFVGLAYRWQGASINYYIEYIHKDQDRPEELNLNDQVWKVWRSKATLEVAW